MIFFVCLVFLKDSFFFQRPTDKELKLMFTKSYPTIPKWCHPSRMFSWLGTKFVERLTNFVLSGNALKKKSPLVKTNLFNGFLQILRETRNNKLCFLYQINFCSGPPSNQSFHVSPAQSPVPKLPPPHPGTTNFLTFWLQKGAVFYSFSTVVRWWWVVWFVFRKVSRSSKKWWSAGKSGKWQSVNDTFPFPGRALSFSVSQALESKFDTHASSSSSSSSGKVDGGKCDYTLGLISLRDTAAVRSSVF